jgi:hypothetical protein
MEPVHIEGEIINPSQKDIGRNRTLFEHSKELLSLRVEQRAIFDEVEGRVGERSFVSLPRLAVLARRDFIHDVLPGPLRESRIAFEQIDPSFLQIQRGRLVRFVLGLEQRLGFLMAPRFQALSFFGERIKEVEASTANVATNKTESRLHSCSLGYAVRIPWRERLVFYLGRPSADFVTHLRFWCPLTFLTS